VANATKRKRCKTTLEDKEKELDNDPVAEEWDLNGRIIVDTRL